MERENPPPSIVLLFSAVDIEKGKKLNGRSSFTACSLLAACIYALTITTTLSPYHPTGPRRFQGLSYSLPLCPYVAKTSRGHSTAQSIDPSESVMVMVVVVVLYMHYPTISSPFLLWTDLLLLHSAAVLCIISYFILPLPYSLLPPFQPPSITLLFFYMCIYCFLSLSLCPFFFIDVYFHSLLLLFKNAVLLLLLHIVFMFQSKKAETVVGVIPQDDTHHCVRSTPLLLLLLLQ